MNDIIECFYNGNFSQAVEQMRELNLYSRDLLEYLINEAEDLGYNYIEELYKGHFSPDFWLALGREGI